MRRRRKNGEPCPDDQLRLAARRRQPLAAPFRDAEPAVQHRDARAGKRIGDSLLELGRQADLRNEQQRLVPGGDDLGGGLEVNGGLAAAGHALQQRRPKASLPRYRGDQCSALIGIELVRARRCACLRRHRLDPAVAAPRAEHTPGVRAQRPDLGGRGAMRGVQQRAHRQPATSRSSGFGTARRSHPVARGQRRTRRGCRNQRRQHLRKAQSYRLLVVGGDERREIDQVVG